MRIVYAFIADMAQVRPDQKIDVIGGGIDSLFVPAVPNIHPILTIVIQIEILASECGHPHQLEVLFWDADGNRLNPYINATFSAERNPLDPTAPSNLPVAVMLTQLQIPRMGDFSFRILIDARELATLPLRVRPRPV
jgi:hypothetical protein